MNDIMGMKNAACRLQVFNLNGDRRTANKPARTTEEKTPRAPDSAGPFQGGEKTLVYSIP